MTPTTVTYKLVPGFTGYQVGDDGTLWGRRLSGYRIGSNWRRVKGSPDKDGYLKAILYRDDGTRRHVRIHVLILEVFKGPCPAGMVAAHDNGNETDNRLSNLLWKTQKANIADKVRHGTSQVGERGSRARLTAAQVVEIRKRWAAGGVTQYRLATEYGVKNVTICAIVKGRIWKHLLQTNDAAPEVLLVRN